MSEHSTNPKTTAVELRESLRRGDETPANIVAACRARIEAREDAVGAWQALNWDFVDAQVAAAEVCEIGVRGPLFGLPVGIKDIFDTADLPTGYGSDIYVDHRPAADAACVARLRSAGAIILGKTVSTEFAYWKAGKTRNPLNLDHSPGGSSSGSVAAVADGMVPLAIGSQTAASTIRPAAYCGIVGYKPTRGLISLAGVKALSNSLDTVGVFGCSVADAAMIAGVMMGNAELGDTPALQKAPEAAVLWSPEWHLADDEAIAVTEQAAAEAKAAGAVVRNGTVPDAFADLTKLQTEVMAFEAARELAHERRVHADRLSAPLLELFAKADAIAVADNIAALAHRDHCLAAIEKLFHDAKVLLAPSTLSTAPRFEDGTGDPTICRAWTLLGLPSITIPWGVGANGLPLGLQLAARPGHDRDLIQVARWFEALAGSGG